jgi:hypothetical protein
MTQYLVAIHHPDDYDPSTEDEAMSATSTHSTMRWWLLLSGFSLAASPPPAARGRCGRSPMVRFSSPTGRTWRPKEHIGGFWVLEAANLDDALAWGRKAAVACRAPVEVRPFGRTDGSN